MARIAAPNPRIIEMVKQGLTTDAICAELCLRPRGLEHHITLARKQGLLPPSKFDPRRIDREGILNAWYAGMSRRQIVRAGIVGKARTVERVIETARRHGDPRAVFRERLPSVAVTEATVQQLRAEGLSLNKIAARVGCHHSTVKKLLEGTVATPEPVEPEPAPYTPPPIRRRVSALLEDQRVPELHRARKPAAPGICERVPVPAAQARAANRSPAVLSTRWADGWEGV